MANFKAWKEPTRAGNFVVRFRDGTRDDKGKLKKFKYCSVDKNQKMMVDGKLRTGAWLADALAEKLVQRHHQNDLGIIDSSQPLPGLAEEYIEKKRKDGKALQTILHYENSLKHLLEEIPTIKDLTTSSLQEWKDTLEMAGYSRNTTYGFLNDTSMFCNWLVRENKLQKSPFPKGMVGAVAGAEPRFYTTAEFMALDATMSKLNHYARIACRLARDYGLRKVEIVGDGLERMEGILWEDLIWRSDGKVDLMIRKGVTKGRKKSRKIHLGDSFVSMLGSRKSGAIVQLKKNALDDLFQKARKLSGINPALTFHGLRHTFAKDFLQRTGSNQVALRDLMGHTDVKTTQIYSQFEQSYLDDAMEKLQENRQREEGLLNLAGQKDDTFPETIKPRYDVIHRDTPYIEIQN